MAQELLTKESPEIICFFENIKRLSVWLQTSREMYRPILNGEHYLTEIELSEKLKVTRRTLIEYRNNGILPFYRFGGRILYKESDILEILKSNKVEAFKYHR